MTDNTNFFSLNRKRLLVTGGAGAIGSNLVQELLLEGCTVVVLDDLSSGSETLLADSLRSKQLTLVRESITDDSALSKAFNQKIDIVFHLAALFANQNSIDHPEQDLLVNGLGTLKLLERARCANVERFIYINSSCVYGNAAGATKTSTGVSEEFTDFHLDTPYAITKLLGEKYVTFFHEYYGLKTVTLRVFNSFGPGEMPGKYRNVVPNFFAKAMAGESLTIYGTGEETRDFNWIGNLVQAMLLAATKECAIGETFNIGSGKETRIIDLARLINEVTQNNMPIVFKERRDWDKVARRCGNIEKAERLLGYSPEIDLEEHLRRTYEWLKRDEA
jgi:UDP-glucose 4-epimerase